MAKALVPTPNTGGSTESDFTFWPESIILLYMVFAATSYFIKHVTNVGEASTDANCKQINAL